MTPQRLTPSARKDVDDLRDWLALWAQAHRLPPEAIAHCELRYEGPGDPVRRGSRSPRLIGAVITVSSPLAAPDGAPASRTVQIDRAEIDHLKDIGRSAITRTAFLDASP